VSDSVSLESTRRRLTAKQADTIQRLGTAALAVLAREGFGGMTIRLVAAEAGIGAATAYTYFSSKEHLVAEVFWRRLASSKPPAPGDVDPVERVIFVLRHIALLVADEPEFAAAVTNALLGRDPDVQHLRDRIAREIHARLDEAVGANPDPALVPTLELLYTGALVHAGMGYVTYTEIADRLERSARLLFSA
jgi:AcrR family transcriptional regulator